MSTIVYKDGVMGGDTRAWSGSRMNIGEKRKVHRVRNGLLGMSSGEVGMTDRFLRFFERDGLSLAFDEDWTIDALFVNARREIFYFSDKRNFTGPLTVPYITIGSGAWFAKGALDMGASVTRALEIAADNDYCTKGPFILETLKVKANAKPKR